MKYVHKEKFTGNKNFGTTAPSKLCVSQKHNSQMCSFSVPIHSCYKSGPHGDLCDLHFTVSDVGNRSNLPQNLQSYMSAVQSVPNSCGYSLSTVFETRLDEMKCPCPEAILGSLKKDKSLLNYLKGKMQKRNYLQLASFPTIPLLTS